MTIYEHTLDGLTAAAKALSALPDSAFSGVLDNPEVMTAIRTDIDGKRKQSNIRIGESKTSAFPYDGDRSLLYMAIAYYKARRDITPNRNIGAIRKAVSCFGQENSLSWIDSVCEAAGVSFTKSQAQTIKTEQEKDAEQQAGRDAVAEHLSGKRKSVKENPQTSVTITEKVKPQTGIESDIQLSVISPDCFWDYQSACEIVNAEPEPYLIESMFRKGTLNIIGATQNAGKTTLLFDIMGTIASGSKFLPKPDGTGGFQTHQGSCILIDFEGDKIDTASRLRATIDTYSEISGLEAKEIPVLVRYMPIEWTGSDVDFPKKVYDAISVLPEPYNKPAMIAFDTYSAFSDVENENESTQAQKVFNRFKVLKTLFQDETAIFITMHLRKLNDKKFHDVTMDDLRGTNAAAAAGSDIWFLSEVKGDSTTKKLKQVKAKGRSRSDEIKTLNLAYDSNDDGTFARVRFFMTEGTDEAQAQEKQTQRKQRNAEKREKDILAFIATHPKCSLNRICKGDKDGKDRLEMNIKNCKPVVDALISENKIYNLSDDNSYCLVINPKYEDIEK